MSNFFFYYPNALRVNGNESPWGPGYKDNNTATGIPCNPAKDDPCWGMNGNFC